MTVPDLAGPRLKLLRGGLAEPVKKKRKLKQAKLRHDMCVLAARLYREGKEADIEKHTGIPPSRHGEAIQLGLRQLYGLRRPKPELQ